MVQLLFHSKALDRAVDLTTAPIVSLTPQATGVSCGTYLAHKTSDGQSIFYWLMTNDVRVDNGLSVAILCGLLVLILYLARSWTR